MGGVAGRGEGKGGKKLSRVSFPHASDALPGLSAPPQGRLHPPAGLAASRHSLSPTSCKSGCSVPRPAVSSFGAGALVIGLFSWLRTRGLAHGRRSGTSGPLTGYRLLPSPADEDTEALSDAE